MRSPDIDTAMVQAWKLDLKPQTKDQTATVRAWLVHGPWHVAWSYWLVCCVHLRDIEGVRPAKVNVPGASHEFLIVSLQSPPSSAVVPDPDDMDTLRHLDPPDLCQQVCGLTDEQAKEIVDLMVRDACNGESLDSDNRVPWTRRLLITAEHYRKGLHDGGVN